MKKILIILLLTSIYSCRYPYNFDQFNYEVVHSQNKPEFYIIFRDSMWQKDFKLYSFNKESNQLNQMNKDLQIGRVLKMQISKNDSILYLFVNGFEKRNSIYAFNYVNKKIEELLFIDDITHNFQIDESRNRIYYPVYNYFPDSPTRSVGNAEYRIFYYDLKLKEKAALLDTTMETFNEYKLINDLYLFFNGMKYVKDKIQMRKDANSYSPQIKLYLYDLENDKLIDLGRLNKFFDDRLFTNNDVSFIELIGSDEKDCFFVAQHNKVYKFCLKEPSKLIEVAKFAKKTRILSINPTHKKTMLCVLINYKNNEFEIREIDFKGVELNSFMVKDFKFD